MKKTTLLKTMLLLCALIVGSNSLWADTETVTPTNSPNGFSGADHFTYVTGGSGTTSAYSATYVRLYANNTLTITPLAGETITGISISATWNQGGSSGNKAYPTGISSSPSATLGDATPGTGSHTITWSGSTTEAVVFTINGTKGNLQVTSITVTFTGSTKTDPTITFNDGGVRVGKTLDLSTLFSSNSSGDVTYSITAGDSYASIDDNILTGVAEGDVTVQASQASYGAYNAKAVTATISVTDPALSSIAITTAPTKTTYDEGDLFDATGMVVTATFADASTEDVTASCTWTPDGALTTSDTEVTISYTYNAVTKTATQDITVNAYVQQTEFDINLNNTLFGTSYSGTASGITDGNPVSGKLNRVTVTYAGSGDHYINNSQIRFYPSNKLTFAAPAGYIITQIVFTADGTWTATINANTGTYNSSNKTWTGEASSVLFTGSGSGQCRMSKATITLSNAATVKITSSSGFATLFTPFGLDFSTLSSELKAYTATYDGSTVTLTQVNDIPANTGVVLKGSVKSHSVPVAASSSTPKGSLEGSATAEMAYNGKSGYDLYMLALNTDDEAQFTKVTSGSIAAGKAYLPVATGGGANELTVVFNDEEGDVTGIKSIENGKQTYNNYYDLMGRKVAQPTKGLYIVNGKKVIIK